MFDASAEIFDALYSFRDMRGEARRALAIAKRAAHRQPRTILDLGCATGDHAAFLAKDAGAEVVGLDLDRKLLSLASAKHPRLQFVRGDMVTARLDRRFDAVFSFYGVIAYVRSRARLLRFARNVARHLAPGGVAVIEPWHVWGEYDGAPTARHVVTGDLAITRASVAHVSRRSVTLEVHYLIAKGTRVRRRSELHRVALFSRAEQVDAFRAAGLDARFVRKGPAERGAIVAVRRG